MVFMRNTTIRNTSPLIDGKVPTGKSLTGCYFPVASTFDSFKISFMKYNSVDRTYVRRMGQWVPQISSDDVFCLAGIV